MAKKMSFEAGTYKVLGESANGPQTCWLRFGKQVERAMVERLAKAKIAERVGVDFLPKKIQFQCK